MNGIECVENRIIFHFESHQLLSVQYEVSGPLWSSGSLLSHQVWSLVGTKCFVRQMQRDGIGKIERL